MRDGRHRRDTVPEGAGQPHPPVWAPALTPVPRTGSSSNDVASTVSLIRSSFAAITPRSDEVGKLFYGLLFYTAPETRDLFPVAMGVQRSRFLRALIHVLQTVDRPDDVAIFLRQLGRDHRKFGVLAKHYEVVGDALLRAMAEVSGPRWTPQIEHAWRDAYDFVATIMRDAAESERGPAVWMARITHHQRLLDDLAVVRAQTSVPIPYAPGQYLSIEIHQRPRMWRSLSPANAPDSDGIVEFHVRAVPEGWVSRAIVAHSNVGDVWRIGPPMGQLTLAPQSERDVLMVVGGTGLSPALAILEELVNTRSTRRVGLFYGGRDVADLYAIDRLRALSRQHPWLTVIPVVEHGDEPGDAEVGTLAEVVSRYGAWADRETMISGSPDMVRATVSAMLEAGTPLTRIHYDPFTAG